MSRIYLSPPDVADDDRDAIVAAVESGWIAPLGPEVDAFERDVAAVADRAHACALASGTAGLHLALLILGVGAGDRVVVSTLTFAATVNAIRYVGAEPVFVDAEATSWNLDPELLGEALARCARDGRPARAVIAVDLYGQCARYDRITAICRDAAVPLVADAAESLGACYQGRPAGSFGDLAVFSFNGNKIITTSGGGMLVSDRVDWVDRARFLATQARDSAPHYEHSTVGFNYRMSNLLAALGRSQLRSLPTRVDRRRAHNAYYRERLAGRPGVQFMPEVEGGRSTFWLTALTIDPAVTGVSREDVRLHLESLDIEARPVWKPMHLQPVFRDHEVVGGDVARHLFEQGLCLPSGSTLTDEDRARVADAVEARLGS
ncbi:MAG: aminotransferase class I/II-fold pyridoxal phosphate-dependent enzyme [Myxococcales bacterium]|nr:aminotransferase class I/II-fold pyridoxal phosphate-dependent enzyme [Myxococcales bacterium]